jgi:predicted nucleic acid-binding protein
MSIYIDTSALLAILDADDINHSRAKKHWGSLIVSDEILQTSNYVLLEASAIIQSRMGIEAVRAFQTNVYPVLMIEWITQAAHDAAMASLLLAGRRRLSLVDCTSFDIMHQWGIAKVFSFDKHFTEQGFECIP